MSTTSDSNGDSQSHAKESQSVFKRLLYATDFSVSSQEGLQYATALARDMSAELIIAHVEEPMETYAGGQFYGPDETIREQLEQSLKAIIPLDQTVEYSHHYETGASGVASGILGIAKNENADLIVIGTHGRTGLRRLLMGSVAEKVVRQAKCPVLTFTPSVLAHELDEGE